MHQEVEGRPGEDASDGVDGVVCLYVERGEEHQRGEHGQHGQQPMGAHLPRQPQQHHADAHMARGEGGGGALTGIVGLLHQVVEQAIGTRNRQRLLVHQEVVPNVGERTLSYLLGTHSSVVELRTGHRQEDEDDVEQEERTQDDESTIGETVVVAQEIIECHGAYHGVVADVAQAERLADEGRGELLREDERGLAAEEPLLGHGEEMVEVAEEPIKLVGVGIPPPQHAQLCRHAQHHRPSRGPSSIEQPQHDGEGHDTQPSGKHGHGVHNLFPQHCHKQQREGAIGQHRPLKQA